jgi:hypothetical protein
LWLGFGFQAGNAYFKTPNPENFASGVYNPSTGLVKFRNVHWFTNLEHSKRYEEAVLYRQYSKDAYPEFDHYDAIEVGRLAEIPVDYPGAMAVPITFLDKYNPRQFEILSCNDIRRNPQQTPFKEHGLIKDADGTVNGKAMYVRIAIKARGSAQ